jgi:hypothetical protein
MEYVSMMGSFALFSVPVLLHLHSGRPTFRADSVYLIGTLRSGVRAVHLRYLYK